MVQHLLCGYGVPHHGRPEFGEIEHASTTDSKVARCNDVERGQLVVVSTFLVGTSIMMTHYKKRWVGAMIGMVGGQTH